MVRTLEEKRKYNREYSRNTEWVCTICGGCRYKLGSRTNHLKSKTHRKNVDKLDSMGLPIPKLTKSIGRPQKKLVEQMVQEIMNEKINYILFSIV